MAIKNTKTEAVAAKAEAVASKKENSSLEANVVAKQETADEDMKPQTGKRRAPEDAAEKPAARKVAKI